jgi:hypothetical protein
VSDENPKDRPAETGETHGQRSRGNRSHLGDHKRPSADEVHARRMATDPRYRASFNLWRHSTTADGWHFDPLTKHSSFHGARVWVRGDSAVITRPYATGSREVDPRKRSLTGVRTFASLDALEAFIRAN